MDEKKRIFLAEDHTILRAGLRALLSSSPDFEVIGEAEDGREAIRGVENNKPDLIILDLSMPVLTFDQLNESGRCNNRGRLKVMPWLIFCSP